MTLGQLDRSAEAITAYDGVVTRFGDADDLPLRERVTPALFSKGMTLGQLDRSAEEITAYDEVVTRFGNADDPALLQQVANGGGSLRAAGGAPGAGVEGRADRGCDLSGLAEALC
jgi:hypothetical protein